MTDWLAHTGLRVRVVFGKESAFSVPNDLGKARKVRGRETQVQNGCGFKNATKRFILLRHYSASSGATFQKLQLKQKARANVN